MKTIFLFALLITSTGFGQSNKQQLKICEDSLAVQQQIILDLTEQLESAKSNIQTSSEWLEKVKKENETLRRIMKDYVKQIDNDQTRIIELETELDKCKNP